MPEARLCDPEARLCDPEARLIQADSAPSRDNAHAAAARTGGSLSVRAARSAGTAAASPRLPRTVAALRSNPERRARHNAVCRKRSRKAASSSANSSSGGGTFGEANAGSAVVAALRFHGQTSWQTSHPNSHSPISGRSV